MKKLVLGVGILALSVASLSASYTIERTGIPVEVRAEVTAGTTSLVLYNHQTAGAIVNTVSIDHGSKQYNSNAEVKTETVYVGLKTAANGGDPIFLRTGDTVTAELTATELVLENTTGTSDIDKIKTVLTKSLPNFNSYLSSRGRVESWSKHIDRFQISNKWLCWRYRSKTETG